MIVVADGPTVSCPLPFPVQILCGSLVIVWDVFSFESGMDGWVLFYSFMYWGFRGGWCKCGGRDTLIKAVQANTLSVGGRGRLLEVHINSWFTKFHRPITS